MAAAGPLAMPSAALIRAAETATAGVALLAS